MAYVSERERARAWPRGGLQTSASGIDAGLGESEVIGVVEGESDGLEKRQVTSGIEILGVAGRRGNRIGGEDGNGRKSFRGGRQFHGVRFRERRNRFGRSWLELQGFQRWLGLVVEGDEGRRFTLLQQFLQQRRLCVQIRDTLLERWFLSLSAQAN